MKKLRRTTLRSALALATLALATTWHAGALADDAWPNKPVRLVVPFSPEDRPT